MSFLGTVGTVFRQVSTDVGCASVEAIEPVRVPPVRALERSHTLVVVINRGLQIVPLTEDAGALVDDGLCGLAGYQVTALVLAVVVAKRCDSGLKRRDCFSNVCNIRRNLIQCLFNGLALTLE